MAARNPARISSGLPPRSRAYGGSPGPTTRLTSAPPTASAASVFASYGAKARSPSPELRRSLSPDRTSPAPAYVDYGSALRTSSSTGSMRVPSVPPTIESIPTSQPYIYERVAPKFFSYLVEQPIIAPIVSHVRTKSMLEHFTRLEEVAPYSAEFLGTFLYTFTVIKVSLNSKQDFGATAIAFVLMALVYTLSPISGGHLNPAISLATGLAKKTTWWRVFGYMFCQYWGALSAGLFCHFLFPAATINYGPHGDYGWFEAGICEVVFTAMLCLTFLNCFYSDRTNPPSDRNQFYALAIGFVMIAGGYASGQISGGIFNPFVALGVQVVRADNIMFGAEKFFQYAMLEFMGACVGAFLFYALRPEDWEVRGKPDVERESCLANYIPSLSTRLLAEMVGTYLVVVTFGINLLMGNCFAAWSTGAAVMAMTYALSNISGGHFNPAVTLAVVMSGRKKLSISDGVCYVMAQLFSAILGGITCCLTNALPAARMPSSNFTWDQIATAEVTFTFLLCFVMLACSTADGVIADHGMTRQNFYYGLAIGACYVAGGLATASVTGGSINPAISLGLASSTGAMPTKGATTIVNPDGTLGSYYMPGTPTLTHFGYYTFFELFGGLLAALVFHLSHAKEYRVLFESDVPVPKV